MVFTLLPTVVFAADTGKAIQDGIGGISGYDSVKGTYDYIYYGTYDGNPIKWRVLDAQTNTGETGLFLLSEDCLGTGTNGDVVFEAAWNSDDNDGQTNPNEWQNSDAQEWCRRFHSKNLTTLEQDAVLATTKNDSAFKIPYGASSLNKDKVFFLSAEEVENPAYGFKDDDSRIAKYRVWWLRSPYVRDASMVCCIGFSGKMPATTYVYYGWSARPAFNLNLNSVLFSSAAVGGKSSGVEGANALKKVSATTPVEWKLTLKDSRRNFTVTETKVLAAPGGKIMLNYSNATSGTYDSANRTGEFVSAMVTDSSGNILYYGRLKAIKSSTDESGTVDITIPSGLAEGSYTLKVFSEQYNGEYKTDYASVPAVITLTVDNAPTVAITTNASPVTNTSPIPITITFNESVTGFNTSDLTVTNATVSNFSGSGAIYTADIAPISEGTFTIDIANNVAQDMAGNGNTAALQFSGTYDSTVPTVDSLTPSGADVSISGNLEITFSEPMNTTTVGTVQLSADGGSTYDAALTGGSWSASSMVFTVPYSGLSYSTQYTVSVSGFKDIASNKMTSDQTHSFTTETEPLNPSVSPDNLTINRGSSTNFSVAFGQGVTVATGAAITVSNNSIAEVSTTSVTTPGAITVTGLSAGNTDITVVFNDTAATSKTIPVTVQPVTPVWPVESNLTASGITSTGATLTWTPAQDITAVTGYKLYQNGTELATVAGNVYSYTVSGLSASTSYGFQVQAGNQDGVWTIGGPSGTVTTLKKSNSGSGENSESNWSSTDIPTPIIVPDKKPNQPVIASAMLTPSVNSKRLATVAVSLDMVTATIKKAALEAQTQGRSANGIGLALHLENTYGIKAVKFVLSQSVLKQLIDSKVRQLEMDSKLLALQFDQEALRQLQSQSVGDVTISITPVTGLSGEAAAANGGRPVYDITISYVKDGKAASITSLGSGSAILSIPYTPGKNEAAGYLFGLYVDAKGNATRIAGSAYDANRGCVMFTTNHFSQYGIGYTAPTAKFTDISTHWAKEAIDYVSGRGLLSGTSDTAFSPNSAMTRGMLVTALGRLAGVDTKAYTTNSFTDINTDSVFRPYIEWAYKKGIIHGVDNNQFAPDRAITREEIAMIFANYTKATDYTLPITREATAYADASSIGSAYKDSVKAMQQAGIMMGGSDNKFNPKGNATRAEVSSMLSRYIKLTISPATAQGWAQNDAGQHLNYKDGKALIGTQIIDGVKYFLGTDGTLKTSWVKDSDNWRFYSGKTMLVGWWDLGANGNNKTYYFTKDGLMVYSKWLEIDGKWYYFYTDGSLARSTKIDGYEVDEKGVRKTK